jgi:hypothetical protein
MPILNGTSAKAPSAARVITANDIFFIIIQLLGEHNTIINIPMSIKNG